MKRFVMVLALISVLMALPFVAAAQQKTPTPGPTNTPFIVPTDDGRSVQFSAEPDPFVVTQPDVVVAVDNSNMYLVIAGVALACIVVIGVIVRPAVVSAGQNIPPATLEMIIAPVTVALRIAADAAAKTPSGIDDELMKQLNDVISGVVADIKAKQTAQVAQ